MLNTDVQIVIAAAPREHTWAVETKTKQDFNVRTAGRAPREATKHTLLAIALLSGLQSLQGRKLTRIRQRNGNQTPTVNVITSDPTFAGGLRAIIAGNEPLEGLKAGRNLYGELRRVVSKFAVTIELATAIDPRCGILASWGRQHLSTDPEFLAMPPVLRPSVVSASR